MKTKSFINIIFLQIVGLLLPFKMLAQEAVFSATLSSPSVSVSEQFELTFTLNASGSNFEPPSLKDFFIISGPNQSTSMQFINGNMSQSLAFSYILQPRNTGTFKIGSASIESHGKKIKSNPLTITIGKSSTAGQSNDNGSIEKQLAESVYIKAIVNKKSVVRGEPLKVTYKLFSKIDLVDLNVTKLPTLNGFWSQDETKIKKLEVKREVIDGVQYLTSEIKKTVLFAQREGSLVLDPMEAESVVRIKSKRQKRSNDPFEDFFNDPFFGGNYQDMKYIVKSEPVKINVTALPAPAPDGFSGAVGSFSMESFIDKPETKANEPVSLKIKISGEGNIKLIEPVKLILPPDIESYDPKISEKISPSANGISGQKTFEYLLIPRHPGQFKIKPFEFSYYSLAKKKYITLTSPEFNLKVTKGDLITGNVGNDVAKEDIQLIGKDIRFIKTNTNVELVPIGKHLYGTAAFYTLIVSPFALLIFAFFYRKSKQSQAGDVHYQSRQATKIARKRLTQAKIFLDQGNKEKVYDEILKSLWSYFSDKFQIPHASLSKSKIEEILKANGKDEATILEVISIIDQCEFARYAPATGIDQVNHVYEKAVAVIGKMEEG